VIAPQDQAPVAEVDDLTIAFSRSGAVLEEVVRGVSLSIGPGESLGLVGESGCGKSTLAGTLLGFLRYGAVRRSGTVCVDGVDVFALRGPELRKFRGGRVALVPQNVGQALTPSMRVGRQLAETLELHRNLAGAEARSESVELLRRMRLPQPERILRRYPHQLSGGQQQRVGLAIALAGRPKVLVLDEATTGLDVLTQARVLDLLEQIRGEFQVAMLYVSHDLGVIARVCDRVAVMYAGRIVESGETRSLFRNGAHPYTRALAAAVPRVSDGRLPEGLAGTLPGLGEVRRGCVFAPRCRLAEERCRLDEPPIEALPELAGRLVRCYRWPEALAEIGVPVAAIGPPRPPAGKALLQLEAVTIDYRTRARTRRGGAPDPPPTVADITLELRRGETLALVGESGSGKSTIALAIAGLVRTQGGVVSFDGEDLTRLARQRPLALRRRIQLVFQNPEMALNPRHRVERILGRPLRLFSQTSRVGRAQRIDDLLSEVGLSEAHAGRFPGQLSGGQRQRIGIARALAADPDLVLCDEVVSALDVSVQASILRLLDRLRADRRMAYLFVSHDLAVVRALADRVAVIYLGRLCEVGAVADVYSGLSHPYTQALLAAVPDPDNPVAHPAESVRRDEPEQEAPARGCVFQGRCPRRIGEICDTIDPPWRIAAHGHRIRCHLPLDELARTPLSLMLGSAQATAPGS
jgi:peptide/nickel transport system ATP-binding protein